MKPIRIIRTDNWITVDSTSTEVRTLLRKHLTFRWREALQGRAKALARKNESPIVVEHITESFVDDHKGRISCPYGYYERITQVLHKKGYKTADVDLNPHPKPEIFEPEFDRLFEAGIQLRHRGDELLWKIAANENGRFDLPTGYGKSFNVGCIGLMWPNARIAVISDSVTVVRDGIYPELSMMLGDVGIRGGGMSRRGMRVMCYTVDSMHWLIRDSHDFGNFDIVIVDECHNAGADNFAYMLGQIPGRPRMYGFSATQDMRWDNKDFRVEGAFGKVRMVMDYKEAEAHGIVVPMRVRIRRVVMERNPADDLVDQDKLRAGLWQNEYRNDLILRDAITFYKQGEQVMIPCATLEHVLHLVRRFRRLKALNPKGLKDVHLIPVWREQNEQEFHETVKEMSGKPKLCGKTLASLPRMTIERRADLTKKIKARQIRLFVCTTIFNVGFNATGVSVMCRADAVSNEINDRQLPGRLSRTHGKKAYGTVCEYDDSFDVGLNRNFTRRKRTYHRMGWKLEAVKYVPEAFRKKLPWED